MTATGTERRKLTDREVAKITSLGRNTFIARAVGMAPNHLALALYDYTNRPRTTLLAETIDKLLSLTPEDVARCEVKSGQRPTRKEPTHSPAQTPAPPPTPAPAAPASSLRERALELYLGGTDEDRAVLRMLLLGGVR